MGDVGGPRHFTQVTPAATAWTCPTCRTKNTSRFEDGCPACGAGTPAMNAAAQVANQAPVDVEATVLIEMLRTSPHARRIARLMGFMPTARQTVAAALAFAAENGMVNAGGLTQREMLAWARAITEDLDQ